MAPVVVVTARGRGGRRGHLRNLGTGLLDRRHWSAVPDQSAGSMAQAYMPKSNTIAPTIPIHAFWNTAP